MTDKTTRCTQCDAEFTHEELVGATACPSCGTKSLPCSIDQDTTININWHSLRILTIWASNWARDLEENHQKSLKSIIQKLELQRKEGWPALTLLQEVKELPEQLKKHGIECGDIELHCDGKEVYPGKPEFRIVE